MASLWIFGSPPGSRTRGARFNALLLAVVCVGMAYALSVALLLSRASDQRASIMRQAAASARAATHALDLDLAGTRSLLFRWAAAKPGGNGSLEEFLAQAAALPRPPHSAVLLFDRGGRLLLSTAASTGLGLDEASEAVRRMVGSPDAYRAPAVSDAALFPTALGFTIVVAVPIVRNDGDEYRLALAVGSEDLMAIFQHAPPAQGWLAALADSSGTTVVQFAGSNRAEKIERRVLLLNGDDTNSRGEPVADIPGRGSMFIARSRSTASGWTAVVGVPNSVIAAPWWRSLVLIASGGGTLLVLAAGLALSAGPRIARPYVEEIAASEERFRVMADTVPAILFTAGPDGWCNYVNQRFYDLTKMAAGSALGFGWMEAVHPNDRERVMKSLTEPLSEDGVVRRELRLRDGDGEYRWFLGRLRPVRSPDGRIISWIGSCTDIDHLKKTEGALQSVNARLGAVLAGIDECYCTIDHECRVTFVNDGAAIWAGKDPNQIVGRKLCDAIPDFAGTDFALLLRQAIAEPTQFHVEREKSGRWIEVHGYPWAGGQSIFFRDISRRKTAEEALRRTQELLHATMDALSAHIVVVDEKGMIIAANAAWLRFGQEDGRAGAGQRIGSHYLAACQPGISPSDFAAMARGLRAVVEGREREFRMHYSRRAAGRIIWFQMRATRFGEGSRHVVIAHEDVTDITRAEAELNELAGRLLLVQDEERRRIARDLHDTTTQNLVAALMNLDVIGQYPRGFDRAASAIEEVRVLIARSVQELRTLSYLLHPPLLEELGLASALKWFIRGFEKRSGIAIDFTGRGDPGRPSPEVESALFRVVQEALTNVHRHSGSPTAAVRLVQSAHAIFLEIADRGSGIAGPARATDAADPGSLGVGISGMRVRLRQLGGTLEIRSTASGTTIDARVPIGETCGCPADRRRVAARPSPGRLVDDRSAGLGLQA